MTHRQKLQHSDSVIFFRLNPIAACVKAAIAGSVLMAFATPAAAELPVPSAVWASMGGATREVIGNNMNIKQETDRVILNWDKFNVSADSSVNFKQPSASAIALNKIGGQDPSQILGTVTANGQIYLVNKNGFVFGKDSVVNVHGLVASTLNVKDEIFEKGITKINDNNGAAAFENDTPVNAAIKIESGAQIKSAEGGRILVMAPSIVNSGTVESPGGQVIMAAATDKVYLQEAGSDSDVRGLLVEVKTGGKVENLGNITANRGNVTLMGFAVKQSGTVSATTSVNVNGTVRLLAREGGEALTDSNGRYQIQPNSTVRATDTGDGLGVSATVTLAEGSRTEILPELEYVDGAETKSVDGQTQPLSRVEIMANKVYVKPNAEIVAPGGKLEVIATETPSSPLTSDTLNNTSQIVVESGARIDVSGLDAIKTMESNVVEVKLQSNELKDSPLQKKGILFGKTVLVDIRNGSKLFDIQPSIDGIQRSLAERLGKGGQISLLSEGEMAVKSNAVLDFSGGTVTYLDGQITSTKLTSNGRVYDISNADPGLTYDGVYGEVVRVDKKWGVTTVWKLDGPFSLTRFEEGYVDGKDAGTFFVRSNGAQLDGSFLGYAISGRRQRTRADRAKGGTFSVDTRTDQDIIFANDQVLTAALIMDPDKLFEGGIQKATFKTSGAISIAENATVRLVAGGGLKQVNGVNKADSSELTLIGGAIDVAGSIQGAGASVNLETVFVGDALDGHVSLADTARIGLQGRWVNDFANQENLVNNTGLNIDGGKFNIKTAAGDIDLQAGSSVDVSGGAWLQSNRKLTAGSAGEISLAAGVKLLPGANLTIDGVLSGYGVGKGGTLGLQANAVVIRDQVGASGSGLQPLQLDDDFFNKGGFANFAIAANINGLLVKEGATIDLIQENRVLNTGFLNQGNANDIAAISSINVLPAEQRATSSLTLSSLHALGPNPGSRQQNLVVERNVRINADDLSTIKLVSDSSIDFDGSITARGGDVSMTIVPPTQNLDSSVKNRDLLYQASQGIWLGSAAKIDVSGFAKTITDKFGRVSGDVFNGGSLNLIANRGFVATKSGSVIDVSGTKATLDMPNNTADGIIYSPANIGSHAGSIGISAAEGIFLDGDMQAKASTDLGASGGALSVRIDATQRDVPTDVLPSDPNIFLNKPRILTISQDKTSIFSGSFKQAGDALPKDKNGLAFLAARQVADAGFSSVSLHADDEIRFQGDVSLTVNNKIDLDAPRYGWEAKTGSSQGVAELTATTVSMGAMLLRKAVDEAAGGNGRLTVKADLIDLIGGSVTRGINEINLIAKKDIRLQGIRTNSDRDFVGEFKTFSKLNLTAGQIYPTTLTDFTLAVAGDVSGTIAFSGNGNVAPVLSAYGKLTVAAPNIEQNGIVKTPFGEIVLKAENTVNFGASSITSVSAEGLLIPFGITSAGLDWLYPIGNQNLTVKAPQKKISVTADKILRNDGALVDLSGGGDLQAYEFIPGPGGSKDVLDTSKAFAVLPNFSGYAPFDPMETPASGLNVGDSVYLGTGSNNGLAAGQYTLLPAHYALLPGAFLITPNASSGDVVPGSSLTRVDGAPIVMGYRTIAGTGIKDQKWSQFVVEPGDIARTRSEFVVSTANKFFNDQAINKDQAIPRLPQDAGHLALEAFSQLELPSVRAEGVLGGLVDIISDNINIVTAKTRLAGVELLASDISKVKASSLLVGGRRSFDADTGNTLLDVKANSVTIAENAQLAVPELILAATDKVEIKKGARIAAEGKAGNTQTPVLETTGDGALLRVSAGGQANIQRTGAIPGLTGDLLVDNGAVIVAGKGSILMDSTHNNVMDGEFELYKEGSLNIGAGAINIGEVSGLSDGLSIDNALLNKLAVAELILTSRSSINLYGDLSQVKFDKLVLNSAGLSGYNNAGASTQINANSVTLANYAGVGGNEGTGSGTLNINAGSLVLDKGKMLPDGQDDYGKDRYKLAGYKVSGYQQVNFNLENAVVGREDGLLSLRANTTVNTGVVSGESMAKTKIDASGYNLTLTNAGQVRGSAPKGIAARLDLVADSLMLDTRLTFNGGIIDAKALQGDVTLGNNAVVDVTGTLVKAGLSAPAVINAGQINLTSENKSVIADAGSQLLLSANTAQMRAGTLNVKAVKEQVALNGFIDAHGLTNGLGGNVIFDVNSLGGSGFGGLSNAANNAGFTGGFDLRLRSGDISVDASQKVTAKTISIAADTGKISVDGLIDARGDNGGSIALAAADQLTLNSSASLLANTLAERGNGGKVFLTSLDQDTDGAAGIEIKSGAHIDVSKAGVNKPVYAGETFIADVDDGEVHLRADRKDTNADGILDVNVKAIPTGSIVGDVSPVVEAVKIYNDSSLSATDITTIKNETAAYMNALSTNNVVKNQFANSFEILPGIEVRSVGNIELASKWDLATWRYGAANAPGFLTFRAANNVVVKADLSDGFVANGIVKGVSSTGGNLNATVADMLKTDQSWSYKLVAGADNKAANNAAVVSGTGDLKLENDKKIRTGTGDIELYAGHDIVYGNDKSVIYTAGRAVAEDGNGSLANTRYGFKSAQVAADFYAEYPIDGGDITVMAGRNIKGVATPKLINEWLVRTGNWNPSNGSFLPTAWGIKLSKAGAQKTPDYRQSLGALGGGDINIRAGGDISDLSVVIPTTGKQVGEYAIPYDSSTPATRKATGFKQYNFNTNVVEINGGGNLDVTAGGDIAGGAFYVDGGAASLAAAGSLKAGSQAGNGENMNPILALGETQFKVTAGKHIALESVIDPMVFSGSNKSLFRYSADSSVTLTALTGDVTLDTDGISATGIFSNEYGTIYPAALKAYALEGDINILRSLTLFPSAKGTLELFAHNSIASGFVGNPVYVTLSDADPKSLPNWDAQTGSKSLHANVPVHEKDASPVLVSTDNGDIVGNFKNELVFALAKPALVRAGNDILNVSFKIQHNTSDASSLISAARDIKFSIDRDEKTGTLINSQIKEIEVSGPGQLTLMSGRNVDLGASKGISSVGNTFNTALADDGANVTVVAGVADGNIDVLGFADKYLASENKEALLSQLTQYMRDFSGKQSLTPDQALVSFSNLSKSDRIQFEKQLLSLVQKAYFQKLKVAGKELAAAITRQQQNAAEFAMLNVVETLFPGTTLLAGNTEYLAYLANGGVFKEGQSASSILSTINADQTARPKLGDISLFFSKIHTTDGGDINLMTPNGGINAGLAVTSEGQKKPDEVGIVVGGKGDINAIVRDNFAVNLTRVMTLSGGSILAGSLEENVNAGLGAKSALSAPAPITTFDTKGNPILKFPPVLAGSGIRAIGQPAGDVVLFAPRGVIDAGEAGIGGNGVYIGATAIIGADNIDIGGTAVGVPVAATGSVAAGLTGVSNMAAAVNESVDSASNVGKDAAEALAKAVSALGILSVEILGFGE